MIKRSIVFNKTEERPRCHCSVIQELPNNELMVIWYAGKREAHKSVGIMASWKPIKNEESAWSEPKLIHKTPNKADGNAILKFFNGKLYMFYNVIVGKFFPWTKVVLMKKVSEDYGRNWSDPETIIGKENKGYTVRNKPLIVED